MHWQRLDRDTSAQVIDSVKSDSNAGMFSIGTSEVQRARVSFYKNHFIYKVTNYASLPSFTFQFLSDGTFFQYLDGTEDPIHAVNDGGGLELDQNNVLDYLDFYFKHVGDEDGDITLMRSPQDMPLLDSLAPSAYDEVFNKHKPPAVNYDGGFDAYEIEADMYRDTTMVRAKIEVNMKGRVTIKGQKMITHQLLDSANAEAIM